MKRKVFISILSIIIIFSIYLFSIIESKNKNSKTIKLAEVTHSVFYAPLYVAIENNYFKEENLDIELILTPGADKVSSAVLSGDVQIGLAGTESIMYIYDKKEKDYLQSFCGLTKRDGQFIISKNKDFKLEDLYNKEILVGRYAGMPSLSFLNALKNNNIDINKIKINYSIDFASLSGSFISGIGDYVNLFEPNATTIEKNNYGYVVASIGKLSGEVPYTTFYAKKSYIKENKDELIKFTRAINKGLIFVKENDASLIADIILKQFPDTNKNDLIKIINRYKENDTWLGNPFIAKDSYNNLTKILKSSNLLNDNVPYDKIIVNMYEQ